MTNTSPSIDIRPFRVEVAQAELDDLMDRLARTRLPQPAPGDDWDTGTPNSYLRDAVEQWRTFDWRAAEERINSFPHFVAEVDGQPIHFIHVRSPHAGATPLLLAHTYPGSSVDYLDLIDELVDPVAHGGRAEDAFDVVIPDAPGYGFSQPVAEAGWTMPRVARAYDALMRGLGYERYGAHGTDFGAGVSTFMALDDPEPMIGVHLSNLDNGPYTGPGSRPLSGAERAYLDVSQRWYEAEGGYKAIQSTKPQTVGYGLNDSPAGLASWVLEKWRSWSDSGGDLDGRFSREFLLTVLTIFWATQTIAPSMRDYYDNRRAGLYTLGRGDFVDVPTAIAVYANHFVPEGAPPREWAERLYNVRQWTPMPRGGHFAAAEEPELLARDIAAFFAEL